MKSWISIFLILLCYKVSLSQDSVYVISNSPKSPELQAILPDSLILEGIDAEFVLNRYINAIGGRDNLSSVNDRVTRMTGKVQEFEIKMVIYQKRPNLLRQEINASGLDQVIVYDGQKGMIRVGDDTQVIEGDDLQKLYYEADMDLMLNPGRSGIILHLENTEMIGDTRAYKIINVSGDYQWISYYCLNTGLKIREQKEVKTPSGIFIQDVYFSNYKDIEGVKYPFSIKQKLGSQEMDFTVTSIKVNQELDNELFTIQR